jgi:hypothetical protein
LLCWVPFEAKEFRCILFIACFGVALVSIAFSVGLVIFYSTDKKLLEEIIRQFPEKAREIHAEPTDAVDRAPRLP